MNESKRKIYKSKILYEFLTNKNEEQSSVLNILISLLKAGRHFKKEGYKAGSVHGFRFTKDDIFIKNQEKNVYLSHFKPAIEWNEKLCEVVSKHYGLKISFLEISVFDPIGPEYFFPFFASNLDNSDEIIDLYLKEMSNSLLRKGDNNEIRLPIIPDSRLYLYPYFYLYDDNPKKGPNLTTETKKKLYYFGCYEDKSSEPSEKSTDDNDTVYFEKGLENFLLAVLEIMGGNFAFVKPFHRPVGKKIEKPNYKDLWKGGAVFIFGIIEQMEQFNIDEFSNDFTHLLSANIATMSHDYFQPGESKYETKKLFVHQAKGLIDGILIDNNFEKLSNWGQASAWHLQYLINVWGNIPLNTPISIIDGIVYHWESSLTNKEFLDKLIFLGILHAVCRADMAMGSEDFVGKEVNELINEILKNSSGDTVKLVSEIKNTIRYKIEVENNLDIPGWVKRKIFIIMFHHCFWQAVYHALRAYCKDKKKQNYYLKIYFSKTLCSIKNKIAEEVPLKIKDNDFFDLLNKKAKNLFRIDRPDKNTGYLEIEIEYNVEGEGE